MKILQLSGTSDARQLAIELKRQGFDVLTTVVTSNAAIELQALGLQVLVGRLTDLDLIQLIKERQINIVVDASHPYAEEASKNAIKAAQMAEIPYIRFERPSQQFDDELIIKVDSYEEAAELAAKKQGNIMLTTGSKTLQIFTDKLLPLPNTRVIARMLPRKDNMEKCEGLGLPQKNIIAIQGPFTKDFNKALFKQFEVTLMVTKESGKEGAVDEKVEAAMELGIETILIKRPRIQYGISYSNAEDVINHIKGVENNGF
ncbi:cobalt-precorrin 6A reductase [Schinkia azotoformans MEV2011]|uniref:Cobalt-precorrin 6A reductase n=1 Tax=Schinkia azotoformans MEV2011 TaxID=1348973 RepID=A0A072P0C9_SCHAZ|nr:precorrin-6A reductase [Schinkia azotoformans]KEF38960.1 cobalt-precorrin 6A reductase [Schinkia azotoformans MEV2011]MEC1694477.1 precorrin-6A reductase [Schinkia azotoformans]MEC1714516.1 precorrin-6A reductase [Schinkia azotoformans]MEC1723288.1 precorrin-6A reductase [Schinkia azotoformans]MEC1740389.1 precorrin-6A reductase [Schinkia azotoformans]